MMLRIPGRSGTKIGITAKISPPRRQGTRKVGCSHNSHQDASKRTFILSKGQVYGNKRPRPFLKSSLRARKHWPILRCRLLKYTERILTSISMITMCGEIGRNCIEYITMDRVQMDRLPEQPRPESLKLQTPRVSHANATTRKRKPEEEETLSLEAVVPSPATPCKLQTVYKLAKRTTA